MLKLRDRDSGKVDFDFLAASTNAINETINAKTPKTRDNSYPIALRRPSLQWNFEYIQCSRKETTARMIPVTAPPCMRSQSHIIFIIFIKKPNVPSLAERASSDSQQRVVRLPLLSNDSGRYRFDVNLSRFEPRFPSLFLQC